MSFFKQLLAHIRYQDYLQNCICFPLDLCKLTQADLYDSTFIPLKYSYFSTQFWFQFSFIIKDQRQKDQKKSTK